MEGEQASLPIQPILQSGTDGDRYHRELDERKEKRHLISSNQGACKEKGRAGVLSLRTKNAGWKDRDSLPIAQREGERREEWVVVLSS